MAKCSFCGEETNLYVSEIPTCPRCDSKDSEKTSQVGKNEKKICGEQGNTPYRFLVDMPY